MKNRTLFLFVGSFKVGGVERVVSLMAENFMKVGYEVKILLLRNIIELPVEHLEEHIIHLNTQDYENRAAKISAVYFQLWKFYWKYKPFRIISFSSELNVLLFSTMLPNQVFRIDTNLFWVRSKLYRRRLLKIIGFLPNVKKVITPSNELRLKFKPYLPAKSFNKFVTIRNPLNTPQKVDEAIQEQLKKPFFVSVGRLDVNKGFQQLIRCFAAANFKTKYHLYILGSGPMERELMDFVQELELEARVKLVGFQRFPQTYVANAEALILNSSFESFGNVLVEALSLNVPIISNDCDFGPREIIEHEKNGLLYKQEKDENLIKVLEQFVNNDTLRERLKKNTSYRMDRFDPDQITKEWIEKVLT